jgi:hypothetical protein
VSLWSLLIKSLFIPSDRRRQKATFRDRRRQFCHRFSRFLSLLRPILSASASRQTLRPPFRPWCPFGPFHKRLFPAKRKKAKKGGRRRYKAVRRPPFSPISPFGVGTRCRASGCPACQPALPQGCVRALQSSTWAPPALMSGHVPRLPTAFPGLCGFLPLRRFQSYMHYITIYTQYITTVKPAL